ncbi:MAG: N-acetyl-gamma-glutamyl-phosphate reductase, partial [Candidatus Firestonebacteria bacterium]|nr:N-acetyl-gamma-glutamyl-phosphate reductase [Candidatus Firestonebacteria bacterium]
MIHVGIIGAGSLVANEIIKILCNHPESKLTYVNSRTFLNKPLCSIDYTLHGKYDDLLFQEYSIKKIKKSCDVVFISRSHGESSPIVKDIFYNSSCKIIDLGADFRIKDNKHFEFWYHGAKHVCFELVKEAVYGLPELHGDKIKNARLVANPGCYATSIILAVAPLIANNFIDPLDINIVASSGISGAGREPKPGFNMFIDLYGNVKPYKIGIHPHIGEIEQELKCFSNNLGPITFIPQVVPLDRGIMSIITFKLTSEIEEDTITGIYNKFYSGCNFVKILKNRVPEIKDVVGTNICEINPVINKHSKKLTVFSTLDNLVKGAGGQAVQNMNIMFG